MIGALWSRIFDRVEAWLRVDCDGSRETVTRTRAVYVVALVLGLLQAFNTIALWISYERWSTDSTIALVAALILPASIVFLRWSKNFTAYATFYTILSISCVSGSALQDHVGINSALLPMICIGPMIIGYILDWRAALAYGVAGLLLLGFFLWWAWAEPHPLFSELPFTWFFQRWLQATLALILGTVLAVNASYNTYANIRRLEESLARAKQAEAAKSQFLATMSHELRTPLNGVIGMAEALDSARLDDKEKELVATIRRSGESLLFIIGDLLDLSKIEAGKMEIERQPFAPRRLIEHAAKTWRAKANAKSVNIEVSIADDFPEGMIGDEHRTGQIINNLVSNAVKFTDEGTITIEGLRENGQVVFRVTDTGRGIPEDQQAKIFDAFEQGESGITRRYGGTGLGLQICKLLAGLLDGSIELERSAEDQGSSFRLTLPLREAQIERPERPQSFLHVAPELEGLHVLVAEDNHVNQLVLREYLRRWKMTFIFADDGPSTLDALEADHFDLLLLDKHMPGMSGPEVAAAIRRSDAPYKDIPIIAVSADTMSGEDARARAAGMDGYVSKPVRPNALLMTIAEVLEDRALARNRSAS
ncbi:ATP-binding protein [Parvularcula lutaonensis]|uniref:histidine kinase n=1 Tax=Parvularcula lutaonensis TaxID=491923 RepID=A0ABV7M9E5_9PROT|nr:ATP-binding protein [Parvularcula lutaonensis]GGY44314.1 hypothetical protein GCM10007148_11510 [Parvularcula lutaonensis]